MRLNFIIIALVILFGGFIGHRIVLSSWDGMVYVYVDHEGDRIPAAVKGKFDFSNLKGSALEAATQERLLSHAKIVTQQEQVGIELGHFVRKGDKGTREFACSSFDTVELEFVSTDISVHGDRPKMKIEGSCKFTSNLERIDPIWVPVKKIKSEKPGNVVLEYWENGKVTISFENMGGQWPEAWQLESARLYKRGLARQLRISSKDVKRILKGESINLNFARF